MLDAVVFDNSDFESRLARNEELMALVAAEFLKEATGLLSLLEIHLIEQDWANLSIVTNRLKGAALEVSGYQFCAQLNLVEGLIVDENSVSLESAVQNLHDEFDRLSLALKHDILK